MPVLVWQVHVHVTNRRRGAFNKQLANTDETDIDLSADVISPLSKQSTPTNAHTRDSI